MARKPSLGSNPLDPLAAVLGEAGEPPVRKVVAVEPSEREGRQGREGSEGSEGTEGITYGKRQPRKQRFTVLLGEDLVEKLRDLAVCRYDTLASLAEEAIGEYLRQAAREIGGEIPPRGRRAVRTGRPIAGATTSEARKL